MTRLVAMLGAVALVLGVAGTGCERPVRGNGRNVLLITLETTRADHLGAYGYARDTSPRLDLWAARGVLFERAVSVSPRTNPSLASLLTSSYPHEHGVRNLLLPLEPEHTTLAEVLKRSGYATAAVQTHPRLVASSGFAQGFRVYEDDYQAYPLANQSVETARSWIREASRADRPWFLWLHIMDPHWTYEPPSPWSEEFGPEDPRPARLYADIRERRRTIGPVIFRNTMPPDEVQAFVDLYDAEIRFTDEAVGDLLAWLDAEGLSEGTVTVLTADHGESLGEHGYFFEHGDFGTEPEIHVPLVVVGDGVPPGRRVPWTVSSLDVAPTVVELLDLPGVPSFRGRSLVPMLGGEEAADRTCLGETGRRFHEENTTRDVPGIRGKWRWIRRGPFKLRHVPRPRGEPVRTLFDLRIDPMETTDVSAENPEIAARLAAELDAWIAEDRSPEREYHISEETREQLRALGYVN